MDAEGTVDTPIVQGRGAFEEDDDWYQFSCWLEEELAPEEPPP